MPKIVFYLVSYYKRLKTNAQNCTNLFFLHISFHILLYILSLDLGILFCQPCDTLEQAIADIVEQDEVHKPEI